MRCRIVIEHDAETGSFTATVPRPPVVVEGRSEEEAVDLAEQAIAWNLLSSSGVVR